MVGNTSYRNRKTGEIEIERVFAESALRFLYGARGRTLMDHVCSRPSFSRIYGWLQRRPKSRAKIASFVGALGIDAGEAEHPLEHYRTLDDFFTRHLKRGARPIDLDPTRVIAPADGRIRVFPRFTEPWIEIKRARLSLDELLEDADVERRYRGGAVVLIRLAPADYHRFHFPDGGFAAPPVLRGRRLHAVHPIALAGGAPSFRNKRCLTRIDSAGFGPILQIEIGALAVGTIEQTFKPGAVERGQEKGVFRFGGSAMVLLFEPGRVVFDADLLADSAAGVETRVRMGEAIGHKP
jgi:phosphatidylserine decarboxylase